jgi:glycine cleavage system H protein
MDGFSYYNIFETKGIEYIITIFFFLLLVPFWIALNRQAKATKKLNEALGILSANILNIPQGIFYSKNHTWTFLERGGAARIGLDDLLLNIIGQVNINKLKAPGDMINKGEVIAEIGHNGKSIKVVSPVSGEVLRTNEMLSKEPEMINEDPYGQGWIYKIKPVSWIADTQECYLAEDAVNWSKKEVERFKDFMAETVKKYSPTPSMVIMQDGGEISRNALAEMPEEIWKDFEKNFTTPTA